MQFERNTTEWWLNLKLEALKIYMSREPNCEFKDLLEELIKKTESYLEKA